MRKQKFITASILVLISFLAFQGTAERIRPLTLEHTTSIVQRPDGSFDVTCVDGTTEVRSRDEVLSDELCVHLQHISGRWLLSRDGVREDMRMCDIEATLLRSNDTVVALNATFLPPCAYAPTRTQQCTGLVCTIQLGNMSYAFDFGATGRLAVTRLSDGLAGIYTTTGVLSNGFVRTETLGGVANILRASNDNGATWKSVCDDSFSQASAEVACREMGFSRVTRLAIDVSVAGDDNYGLDDVTCSGSEASLFDCPHTPWGSDDCGESEHVQLTCAP